MTETHEFVEREGQPTAEVWEIPRRVWFILLSWGLAVLLLAGLLSFWIYSNQRRADEARDRLKLQQDRAMCAMIDVFLQGPDPVAGPAGDRSRSVRAGMLNYQAILRCDQLDQRTG
jgi:hypothetical protein